MKIAISATGKNNSSLIDMRFGRCEYFQIHDVESGEIKIIKNEGQMASGGAGIAAAQQVIDEGADVVITGNLGPNAYRVLKSAEIKAFKVTNIPVEAGIRAYKECQLTEISTPGKAHQGMK